MIPIFPPSCSPFLVGLLTGVLVAERVIRWRDRRALIWRRLAGRAL